MRTFDQYFIRVLYRNYLVKQMEIHTRIEPVHLAGCPYSCVLIWMLLLGTYYRVSFIQFILSAISYQSLDTAIFPDSFISSTERLYLESIILIFWKSINTCSTVIRLCFLSISHRLYQDGGLYQDIVYRNYVIKQMVLGYGIEPQLIESKSIVLPLYEPRACREFKTLAH